MAPRVSVLLPVRDAEETLAECLASLAAQTLEDHEVIAVDDGSRDGSRAILEHFAARDARVVVLAGARRGLVPALQDAALFARAPLLARMDADDVAHPARLSLQAASFAEDARLDVLGSRVALLDDGRLANRGMRDYVAWSNALVTHEQMADDLLVESPLAHPSVMLRATALAASGGYRDFDGPEDYDLWLRMFAAGCRFKKREETLLLWRDSPQRLSRRDQRYGADRFFALKTDALIARLPSGREVVVWGAGPIGRSWARAIRAAGGTVAAFVEVDPRKIGQRIGGAPVVPVDAVPRTDGALHIAAVGQPGARERIRTAARTLGITGLVAVA